MNILKMAFAALIILFAAACTPAEQFIPIQTCDAAAENLNPRFPQADTLHRIMQRYTQSGLPGCAIALYSAKDGWWAHSAGYAKIEDKTAMQICHLHYLQSITKTYTAVAILRLWELKKIDLDAPISRYLPTETAQKIAQADEITVRMLLSHQSGVPDYGSATAYVLKLLQEPDYSFSSAEYLDFIAQQPLNFKPGSQYKYSNTNYLLLALIADAITGNHAQFIQEQIFVGLALKNTFYHNNPAYLDHPTLVNSYWDRFSNAQVENVSKMQKVNVASLYGDDGMVSTPLDAVHFLKGLLEGKLLAPATVALMQQWVKDEEGEEVYGLGLALEKHKGHPAIGHGGSGIGSGTLLFYLPEQQVYVFLAVNLGTVIDGPLTERTSDLKDAVLDVLMQK